MAMPLMVYSVGSCKMVQLLRKQLGFYIFLQLSRFEITVHFKILGIIFDSNLTFHMHISKITNKA